MKITVNELTERLKNINYSNYSQAGRWIYEFYQDGEKLTKTKLENIIQRLTYGEPLQYILGEWDFYGMTFYVGKGVLCPRPETELLAEIGIAHMQTYSGNMTPSVFDLCAGTGCLGMAIQHNYPAVSNLVVMENSEPAVKYLKKNIKRHYPKFKVGKNSLSGRNPEYFNIEIEQMNEDVLVFAKDLGLDEETAYDINCYLMVSNPPYLTYEETKAATSVSSSLFHEPLKALYGGVDGNDFYPAIVGDYSSFLCDGGMMLLEVGSTRQAEFVAGLMEKDFVNVIIHKDLSGNDRAVSGIRKA
ncbi:MAG: methyltransferase [Ruminococcus sp.]|jgi:release factor glutamine methyltransferase|nr:methyltransferase [Ruminococcus sp.]